MKYIKLFENFQKNSFDNLEIEDIEYFFVDGTDRNTINLSDFDKNIKSIPVTILSKTYRIENLFNNDDILYHPPMINFVVEIKHPPMTRNFSFNIENYTKSIIKNYLQRLYDIYDVNIYLQIMNTSHMEEYISRSIVYIQPKSISVKESVESSEEIEDIENYFLELSDYSNHKVPINVSVENHKINKLINGYKISILHDYYDQLFVKSITEKALKRLSRCYKIHSNRISKSGNGYITKELPVDGTNRTTFVHDPLWKQTISISRKLISEKIKNKSTLLIVDVQKSFKKFFNDVYLNELNKYCKNFTEVYQIFDNHVDGKNPDKDYLYDNNPEIPVNGDLYTFPNQVDIIEKRYNYDVDVDFYKKILDDNVYNDMKKKEENKSIKKGDYFQTTEGTIIVYIGNNHRYFHVPKKLYDVFIKFKEAQSEGLREITIVGGADSECLEDVVTTTESLGIKIKRDWKYIWSANHCPIS